MQDVFKLKSQIDMRGREHQRSLCLEVENASFTCHMAIFPLGIPLTLLKQGLDALSGRHFYKVHVLCFMNIVPYMGSC